MLKTDDVLEHMDDVPEVKGKGMEDAAENLSGAVDDVVEGGTETSRPTWRQSELDAAKDLLQNIGRSFAWCCVIKVHLEQRLHIRQKVRACRQFLPGFCFGI